MHNVRVMGMVAAALLGAACSDSTGPTEVDLRANLRFVNATTGLAGSGGFTMKGNFVSGSTLAFGQSTPACTQADTGSASFSFGVATGGGSGFVGGAVASFTQHLTAGGNYTVAAAGTSTNATLFLIDNHYSGTLAAGQAAVRFVNLAPGTEASPNRFTIYLTAFGAGSSPHAHNPPVGAPTSFISLPSGSREFTVLRNLELPPAISGSSGTLELEAGTVSTIAILPAVTGGFQLVKLPRCT